MKLDDVRRLANFEFSHTSQDQEKIQEFLRSLGIDPSNLYQELEMTSPYVDTHQDVSYSNNMMSLHSHSYYELLYCRNTCGVEYLVGSERYRLQRGDLVLIPPGISHRPILPEELTEPYKRDVLWISPEFIQNLELTFPGVVTVNYKHSSLIRTAGTRWEFIGELFRTGVRESEERQPGWEAAVTGNSMVILSTLERIYRDHAAKPLKAEKPELLDSVAGYIEEHYSCRITLGDLAKQFFVSESAISHLFKQKMGVSVYRYVTQRRLIAAKTMIRMGHPLEEVGREVGFSDYSSFYRAFKQEYGISPRQFKQI